jgi:hypothetical protein
MVPHQNFWLSQRCGTIVGVAVPLERFYKPELDAAHDVRLQAIGPSPPPVFQYPCWA